MQDDIDALEDWTTRWQLQFNADKCSYAFRLQEHKYKMNKNDVETELQQTTMSKKFNNAKKILGLIHRS